MSAADPMEPNVGHLDGDEQDEDLGMWMLGGVVILAMSSTFWLALGVFIGWVMWA